MKLGNYIMNINNGSVGIIKNVKGNLITIKILTTDVTCSFINSQAWRVLNIGHYPKWNN